MLAQEDEQIPESPLMPDIRRRGHEDLPVEKLVALPVVREAGVILVTELANQSVGHDGLRDQRGIYRRFPGSARDSYGEGFRMRNRGKDRCSSLTCSGLEDNVGPASSGSRKGASVTAVRFLLGSVIAGSLVLAILLAPFHAAKIKLSEDDRHLWHSKPMGGLQVAWKHWRGSWTALLIATAMVSWILVVLLSLFVSP